jgi:transcriptional regulator with XRE-family HTH domain
MSETIFLPAQAPAAVAARAAFGRRLEAHRVAAGLSVRELAAAADMDSTNLSRILRGHRPPTGAGEALAAAAGLAPGTAAHRELTDLGALAHGWIPPDLVADADAVAGLLATFRAARRRRARAGAGR